MSFESCESFESGESGERMVASESGVRAMRGERLGREKGRGYSSPIPLSFDLSWATSISKQRIRSLSSDEVTDDTAAVLCNGVEGRSFLLLFDFSFSKK
jgi:hypothetical protein